MMISNKSFIHSPAKGLDENPILRLLSAHKQKKDIPLIRKLIDPDATMLEKTQESICEMMLRLTGIDITCCPQCKKVK